MEGQNVDKKLSDLKQEIQDGNAKDFTMSDTELIRFKGRICVPNSDELRKEILEEAHTTPYSVHPGTTKMYHDLKDELGERKLLGPDAVQYTNEAIQKIMARMVTTLSRQKSYVDLKCKHVEFEVGDHVFLRVTPRKGILVKRFGKKGKLSPRYVRPFGILDRVGNVAYMEDLSIDERPMKILDRKDKFLRNKTISLLKVLWMNSVVEEATWELEFDMLQQYPELFE
ncbi:uncharacterized protein LOC133816513 [Humulus lupulus]|uniref:uncharacterized protein LOC133816513 n=1 Tax=Humulus lupulus TaxID=3486 RepID=UPI002B406696|nr:uncharacterized protein LOC133816513 [Humulus lupulus]